LTGCRPSAPNKKDILMKKLMLFAAIAALSLVSAQAAVAQAAISEPGLYSFYHPSGDLLGYGARAIHPSAAPLNAMPPNALASIPPHATHYHRRAPR
jgi:hypothetical protein